MIIVYNGTIISNNGIILSKVSGDGPGPGPFTPFSNDYSFDFDGTDDYVNSSYAFTGNSDFTISFWVKGGTSPGTIYPGIFPISIGIHSNSTLGRMHPFSGYKFMIQSTDNNGLNFGNRIINIDIWDGNWYHIAFKRVDSTGQLFAYVNGVNVDWTGSFGSNTAPSITLNPSGDLYFGAPLGNTSYAWSGELDEVSVFDSALSSGDISAIYNSGTPTDLTSLNPVAWYRMGDNGSYKSPQWLLSSNENKDKFSNYSMSFDGTNDYIDCGVPTYLDGSKTVSVSMWVKFADVTTASYTTLLTLGSSSPRDLFMRILPYGTSRRIEFGVSNNFARATSAEFSDFSSGVWYHVMGFFNRDLNDGTDCEIWLNGSKIFDTDVNTSLPTTITDNMYLAALGEWAPLEGSLCEVAVWNTDERANASTIYNGGVPLDLSSLNPNSYYRLGENATFKDPQWLLPNNENKDKASNYSMSFDGADDYITVPNFTTSGDDVTISFWFKSVNLSGSDPHTTSAFVWGDSNNFVYYNVNEVIYAKINGSTSIIVANSGGVPQLFGLGNWHHLAVVKNGSTVTWWIDGISYSDLGSGGSGGFTMNTIGSATAGAYYFLNGSMDDVAIFDTALSSGDIATVYNNGTPSDLSSLNPLCYWKLGDGATFNTNWSITDLGNGGYSGGTSSNMDINDRVGDAPGSSGNTLSFNMDINDRVGNAPDSENNALSYNMVLSGRTIDVPKEPFSKNSMSFDGTNDYISMGDVLNFERTDAFSLSIWVKPDAVGSGAYYMLLGKMQNSGDYRGYNMQQQYDDVYCVIESTTSKYITIRAANVLSTNVWKHIVFTYDGTSLNAGMNIYVDGSLATVTRGSAGTLDTTIISTAKLTNGRRDGGGDAYGGALDSSSIWDKELSSAEVTAIYNSGTPTDLSGESGLVGYWRMGEDAIFRDPQWLLPSNENKDKFSNYSMSFDGTDDYVETSNVFSLLDGQTTATFSMWIKTDAIGAYQYLFSVVRSATSTEFQVSCYLDNVGRIRVFGDSTSRYVYSNTGVVSAGVWTHLCVTFDLSQPLADRVAIYIDGVDEVAVGFAQMHQTQFATSTSGLSIGRNQNNHLPEFDGLIDEVAVWDSDQSANVSTIYNGGVPSDISSLNPINYWRMGENATFKDPQWLLPSNENKDKFSNYSMSFDGTDDYIDCGTLSYFTTSQTTFSISFWFKFTTTGGMAFSIGNKIYFVMGASRIECWNIGNTTGRHDTTGVTFGTTWHNFTCVFDGSGVTDTDRFKVWIDGSPNTLNFVTSAPTSTVGTPNRTSISNFYTGLSYCFNGNISDVAVWGSVISIGDVWDGSGKPKDVSGVSGIANYWKMGEDATFSTNWNIPDQVGSNDGTSSNMDINDRVGDAPGSSGNTVSFNMDINDRVGEAPNSENNALSYNMDINDKTTDVPT